MATTYYYSANGEMYGESTSGVMTTYMTDALGSTIGTFQAGALVNSYSYSPYGRSTKTGAGTDPRFLWNARSGYRATGRSYAEEYVSRRHASTNTAQWTAVDPLWPDEYAYAYAECAPTTYVDPSGMGPICTCSPPTVHFPRATAAARACMLRACEAYCTLTPDSPEEKANNLCQPPVGDCKRQNDMYPPCIAGVAFNYCGPLIIQEGVVGGNANKSNWPRPKCQTFACVAGDAGGEFCCVECAMRVCCRFFFLESVYKSIMLERMIACLKKYGERP